MSDRNGTMNSSSAELDRTVLYKTALADLSTLEDLDDNNERINRTKNAILDTRNLLNEGSVEDFVKRTSDIKLDSCVLRDASYGTLRCSESISGNVNKYEKRELATHMRVNPDFWTFMFPREIPAVAYLYGTFEPTPPEKRPRAPRKRVQQQVHTLKAPANVDRIDNIEEGLQMVNIVNNYIKRTYRSTKKPLSYFHTVLDPNSFSATVENIYYVSHLVQDNNIGVQLDDDLGLPFITPLRASEREKTDNTEQLVISIDQKKWQDLIEAFGITEPMLKLKR